MRKGQYTDLNIPQDTDSDGWGDATGGVTEEVNKASGGGLLTLPDKIVGRLWKNPKDDIENLINADLTVQEKLNEGATGETTYQLFNKAIETIKSLTFIGATVTDNDNNLEVEIDGKLPTIQPGDAGKKVVVNQTEDEYELVASSTTAGFANKDFQTLGFVNATRTLTITSVGLTFSVINSNGEEFIKTNDSIQIPNISGLHAVYYNQTTGNLETIQGESRSQLYDSMVDKIPVSYIFWNATDREHQFVTDVKKARGMNNTTFASFSYGLEIYVLDGLDLSNDPSAGGTITPSGDLDAHAQFTLSSSDLIWADGKHSTLGRPQTYDWSVYYKNGSEISHQTKTDFSVLTDTDFGLTTTGRLVYNNNGVPTVCTNGDFIWYAVGISNDIDDVHKVVSFMGQKEYGTIGEAKAAEGSERAAIEGAFGIQQEFAVAYMVLFQSNNNYTNGVKSRIREIRIVDSISSSSTSGGGGFISPTNVKVVSVDGVGADFSSIQTALDAAELDATVNNYQTVLVNTGTYVEDLSMPEYVNIIGVDGEKSIILGDILIDHQGTTEDILIENMVIAGNITTDNENLLRITSDGSLTLKGNTFVVDYSGDIGVTCIKIEGNSVVKASGNRILMRKPTTNDGSKDVYAIRADSISNLDDETVNDGFAIIHETADINNNLFGVYLGGSSGTHVSNFLFEVKTTNPSYSGTIRALTYPSDTTPKTFGDITYRIDDSGAGTFYAVDVQSTTGDFIGGNVRGYYNGNGNAYLANITHAAVNLHMSYCQLNGDTTTSTGAGKLVGFNEDDAKFKISTPTFQSALKVLKSTGVVSIENQLQVLDSGTFGNYILIKAGDGATGYTRTLLDIGTGADVYSATTIFKISGYQGDLGGGYLKGVRPSNGTAAANDLVLGTNQKDIVVLGRDGNYYNYGTTANFASTVSGSNATLSTEFVTLGQLQNGSIEGSFTKISTAGNTAYKTKILTGTTDNDALTVVNHGLTLGNIMSFNTLITSSAGAKVAPNIDASFPNSSYKVDAGTSSITLRQVGSELQGQAFSVVITYI